MSEITLLERMLVSKQGLRRASRLIKLISAQRQRLLVDSNLPLIPSEYQQNERLIAACDATLATIQILFRRYHGREMTGDINDG